MSGGFFSQSPWMLTSTAEELESILEEQQDLADGSANTEDPNWACRYSKSTLINFKLLMDECRSLNKKLRAADYLLAGDTGEDSFNRRFKEAHEDYLDKQRDYKMETGVRAIKEQ